MQDQESEKEWWVGGVSKKCICGNLTEEGLGE
jgi:hypothetical protein